MEMAANLARVCEVVCTEIREGRHGRGCQESRKEMRANKGKAKANTPKSPNPKTLSQVPKSTKVPTPAA